MVMLELETHSMVMRRSSWLSLQQQQQQQQVEARQQKTR
jgi:hypothetical protein